MSTFGSTSKRPYRAGPHRSTLRSWTVSKKTGHPKSLVLMAGALCVVFFFYVMALNLTPALVARRPHPQNPTEQSEISTQDDSDLFTKARQYPNYYDHPTLADTLPKDMLSDDQGYAFKMLKPGSLTYKSMPWCPGVPEPEEEKLVPIDRRFNPLIILGAQKAGTTWLFDALQNHPWFHGASHGFRRGRDKWRKEVHFFDQWPSGNGRDYIACFPTPVRTAALAGKQHVLLDASPEYMLTPVAAPRVQRLVPQARFVVILREPAERSLSAWNMVNRTLCATAKPGDDCRVPSLSETVKADLDPHGRPECIFGTADGSRTWGDCWRCYYPTFMKRHCKASPPEVQEAFRDCHPPSVPTTHVSYYAAQLAWWLAFFPPERFLILTSTQLHSPEQQIETANISAGRRPSHGAAVSDGSVCLQALNRVIEHTGLEDAQPFTADMIEGIAGYTGHYNRTLDPEMQAALTTLKQHYTTPQDDLQRLLDTYFPELEFQGLMPES